MKVVAFNGSARKDGNTAILINTVLNKLEEHGFDTEQIQLSGEIIRGCMACYKCKERLDQQCSIKKDSMNDWIKKMIDADGIILGSPVYFGNMSTEMKALIDRAGMVARANGDLLQRKVGAAVVAVRRAGSLHVFNSINLFFTIGQMIIPGSTYWNVGTGKNPGDVESDSEGLDTMKNLGENMAWLINKIKV